MIGCDKKQNLSTFCISWSRPARLDRWLQVLLGARPGRARPRGCHRWLRFCRRQRSFIGQLIIWEFRDSARSWGQAHVPRLLGKMNHDETLSRLSGFFPQNGRRERFAGERERDRERPPFPRGAGSGWAPIVPRKGIWWKKGDLRKLQRQKSIDRHEWNNCWAPRDKVKCPWRCVIDGPSEWTIQSFWHILTPFSECFIKFFFYISF